MRLVTLGVTFAERYRAIPSVVDPDVARDGDASSETLSPG